MKKVTSIDIVIPTYRTEKLVINALKTFMKFNEGFDFNYYIVENSKEDYGKSIKKEFRDVDKIKWISNYTGRFNGKGIGVL